MTGKQAFPRQIVGHFESPIGWVQVSCSTTHLCRVRFLPQKPLVVTPIHYPLLKACVQQLKAYFQGKRHHFDLPVYLHGTDFQRQVWQKIEAIPCGGTQSYGTLAADCGDRNTVRAVGRANATNPLLVVVPCHRVVSSKGALTGYAGGLWRKRWLLQHEQAHYVRHGGPQLTLF